MDDLSLVRGLYCSFMNRTVTDPAAAAWNRTASFYGISGQGMPRSVLEMKDARQRLNTLFRRFLIFHTLCWSRYQDDDGDPLFRLAQQRVMDAIEEVAGSEKLREVLRDILRQVREQEALAAAGGDL
jgi:hypothetical protein